jgi:hypothetical protein
MPDVMVAEDSRRDAATRHARLASAAVSDVPGPSGRSMPYPVRARGLAHASDAAAAGAGRTRVGRVALAGARGTGRDDGVGPAAAPPEWSRRTDHAASPRRRRAGGCRAVDWIATSFSTPRRRQSGIASGPSQGSPRSQGRHLQVICSAVSLRPSWGLERANANLDCGG